MMRKKTIIISAISLSAMLLLIFTIVIGVRNMNAAILSDNTITYKGITYKSIDLGDGGYAYKDKKLAHVKNANKSLFDNIALSFFTQDNIWSIKNDKNNDYIYQINKLEWTVYCKTDSVSSFKIPNYANIYTEKYVDKVDETLFNEIDGLYLKSTSATVIQIYNRYEIMVIIGSDDLLFCKDRGCIIHYQDKYIYCNFSDNNIEDIYPDAWSGYKIDEKYTEYIDQLFINQEKNG